jgi:hypothetical protein
MRASVPYCLIVSMTEAAFHALIQDTAEKMGVTTDEVSQRLEHPDLSSTCYDILQLLFTPLSPTMAKPVLEAGMHRAHTLLKMAEECSPDTLKYHFSDLGEATRQSKEFKNYINVSVPPSSY